MDARRKKLLKRLIARRCRVMSTCSRFLLSRLLMLVIEVTTLLGFGMLVFDVPLRGSLVSFAVLCVSVRWLQFARTTYRFARPHDRRRVRTDEFDHDADVDCLRRVLLGAAFSGSDSAADPGSAADGDYRRTARQHAAGRGLAQLWPEIAVLGAWLIVCFTLALDCSAGSSYLLFDDLAVAPAEFAPAAVQAVRPGW